MVVVKYYFQVQLAQKTSDPLPVPHSRRGGGARYDSHCNLPKPQIPALERLDSVQNEGLVSLVSRSDRVDRHTVGDRELASPRDVLLNSRPHRVSVDASVLLLVDHLGKLALGGFEHDVDCRGVCGIVFHNRCIIAQVGWNDKDFLTLREQTQDEGTCR